MPNGSWSPQSGIEQFSGAAKRDQAARSRRKAFPTARGSPQSEAEQLATTAKLRRAAGDNRKAKPKSSIPACSTTLCGDHGLFALALRRPHIFSASLCGCRLHSIAKGESPLRRTMRERHKPLQPVRGRRKPPRRPMREDREPPRSTSRNLDKTKHATSADRRRGARATIGCPWRETSRAVRQAGRQAPSRPRRPRPRSDPPRWRACRAP